ncbi:phenylalanine--tRNA ligase subunit beta [Candidatus Lariskella endosymbiont of Epinotia ramella]|uniref:phenylalanine--tRNA ligase subunit beta n=1 Tax=Candidatus Lariskella endosymbiont of Epinotia ramella TaxID=3066224 RepID=UPI0030CB4D26
MKFTFYWLKEYLITSESPEKIASTLTNIGFEVESFEDIGEHYKNFCIAEIESTIPNPNADKLKVCTVNDGINKFQVVCGAENARAGIKVVLAKVGAIVPFNKMQIKKSVIRSVESNGMLCSASELLLDEKDNAGIIELPETATIGQEFATYFGLDDVVFEIALTPNRGDCASVYGIARELSAACVGTLKTVQRSSFRSVETMPNFSLEVEDKENVTEFLLQYIEGISNHDKKENSLLRSIGYSNKNTVVDISNFMMMSFGRPSHAYDADKIEGVIKVRPSKDREKFIALGGCEYELPQGLTVIADDVKVLAVAGVIGGELSKVDHDTKNILLEIANFKSSAVIKSGRALNIVTDSRFRFERKVDEDNADLFTNGITWKILAECGGVAYEPIIFKGTKSEYVKFIYFDYQKILDITGLNLSREHCAEILSRLGFVVKGENIAIPSWRLGNIEIIEDIAEEIIRIYGVDKLPLKPIAASNDCDISSLYRNEHLTKINKYKSILLSKQLNEVITWSFVHEKFCNALGFDDCMQIANPISVDLSTMRPTLLIGMLLAVQKNIARDFDNIAMFEIGNAYKIQDDQVRENLMITGVRAGFAGSRSLYEKRRSWDFYDVKSDLLALLESVGMNIKNISLSRNTPCYYHPTKSALFSIGNKELGYCGQLHPKIAKEFDIKIPIMCFEIFEENIPTSKSKFTCPTLSDYQTVSRDFAFLIDADLPVQEVVQAINELKNTLIRDVELFDIYCGHGLPDGKKSVAINVKMQSDQKTLVDHEIEEISTSIIAKISQKIGGVIRG